MPKRSNRESSSSKTTQKKHLHKKGKKELVMGASGQTDVERRHLRLAQRNLQKQILTDLGDAMDDPGKGAFETVRDENNELWRNVRFAREAVLDGENFGLISRSAAKQVDRLLEVPRYDATKLICKLRSKCSNPNQTFNWKKLGQAAGICFNSVPTSVVTFLNGPMDVDYVPKIRKPRERPQKVEEEEEEEEEKEENTKNNTSAADKLSAVEKQMRTITQTLRKRCQNELNDKIASIDEELKEMEPHEKKKRIRSLEKQNDICAIQYLFNPKSFTQTVENIFNFSFLIKKGDAKIAVKKDKSDDVSSENINPRPVVTVMKQRNNIPAGQAIVALNMQDWRDLCKAFNVVKGDIPDRTGSKYSSPLPMDNGNDS